MGWTIVSRMAAMAASVIKQWVRGLWRARTCAWAVLRTPWRRWLAKYAVMQQVADERTWQMNLGSEKRALGRRPDRGGWARAAGD